MSLEGKHYCIQNFAEHVELLHSKHKVNLACLCTVLLILLISCDVFFCVLTGGPGRWPHPMGCAATALASTAAGAGRGAPGGTASVSILPLLWAARALGLA